MCLSETYLTVRYAETDMMGIVHHSRYYPWFEQARTDFIKQTGISYRELEQQGILLPLIETGAKYLRSLTYEDQALITTRLVRLGAAKCEFHYRVYKLPQRELVCMGRTVHGFVNREFRPMNLKKERPDFWETLNLLKTEIPEEKGR